MHLGFIGAKYALCGALINHRNPVTAVAAHATCPACREEHRVNEQTNEILHSGAAAKRVKPEYEA